MPYMHCRLVDRYSADQSHPGRGYTNPAARMSADRFKEHGFSSQEEFVASCEGSLKMASEAISLMDRSRHGDALKLFDTAIPGLRKMSEVISVRKEASAKPEHGAEQSLFKRLAGSSTASWMPTADRAIRCLFIMGRYSEALARRKSLWVRVCPVCCTMCHLCSTGGSVIADG
jgi:hypothetical protein